MIDGIKMIDFPLFTDNRGSLVVIDRLYNIPFEIKRLFYIYKTDQNAIRGNHANRYSEFVMISISGTCWVRVNDGKGNEEEFCLDSPTKGLYLPAMLWKDMYSFSEDNILLILANTQYDETEYIRDYNIYLEEKRRAV